MPNKPAAGQINANVRMPRHLWDNAGQVAAAQGTDRGTEVRNFLRWWTGEPDAKLPTPAVRAATDEAADEA